MPVLGVMNLGLFAFKILPHTFQWLVRVIQNHKNVVELGGPGEKELTTNTIRRTQFLLSGLEWEGIGCSYKQPGTIFLLNMLQFCLEGGLESVCILPKPQSIPET